MSVHKQPNVCICFDMFFKSCVGFALSNCLNTKKKKNTFGIRNTPHSIALSVHKQPSVFDTTYTVQTRVNCHMMQLNFILQRC